MFPNARLVIVAMLASVVAVSCGLGVFAAFRVNHQPFTRLQSADPPLQLVFGSGAPAPVKDVTAAPFGVRFVLNAPVAVPETAAGLSTQQSPATAPDATVPAAEPVTATDSPRSATAETPAPVAAVSSDRETSQQSGQQAAKEQTDQQQGTKEIEPAAEPSAKPDSKSGETGDVALTSPDQPPPAAIAAQDSGPSLDNAAPAETGTSAAPDEKPTARTVAKASRKGPERRVVRVRRFRRAQPADFAQSPLQSFAFTPTYQAMPEATGQQAAPVVRRRVVVKRHRPAAKATAQTLAGNQVQANGPTLATSKR